MVLALSIVELLLVSAVHKLARKSCILAAIAVCTVVANDYGVEVIPRPVKRDREMLRLWYPLEFTDESQGEGME